MQKASDGCLRWPAGYLLSCAAVEARSLFKGAAAGVGLEASLACALQRRGLVGVAGGPLIGRWRKLGRLTRFASSAC